MERRSPTAPDGDGHGAASAQAARLVVNDQELHDGASERRVTRRWRRGDRARAVPVLQRVSRNRRRSGTWARRTGDGPDALVEGGPAMPRAGLRPASNAAAAGAHRLVQWYRAHVIGGPGAILLTARATATFPGRCDASLWRRSAPSASHIRARARWWAGGAGRRSDRFFPADLPIRRRWAELFPIRQG
jgi:hypothetical protein